MSKTMRMFERWKSRPRESLLVRPPATAEGCWQWLHYTAQETPLSGTWPPPAELLELPAALIIPALHCSHFCLPAPPGLKRHEWPQLFEEYVQQPVEDLLVSCLSREAGQLELLVMQRQQVGQWLAECNGLGILITHGWAELQLLPQPEPGHAVRWQSEQLACLKTGSKGQRRQWLVWPDILGPSLPLGWRDIPAEQLDGPWPSRLAPLARLPSVLDRPRPVRAGAPRYLRFTRGQRRLLAGCVLAALTWCAVSLGQTWQQVEGWKAHVKAITGNAHSLDQARSALSQIQSRGADWQVRQEQVAALERALNEWLERQPGWSVASNQFDGRLWSVRLSGAGTAPAQADWDSVANSVGAQWRVEPDAQVAAVRVSFDLGGVP